MAIIGGVRDGALIRELLGEGILEFIQGTLGPEYAAILPLIVSALTLVLVSRLFPGKGIHARTEPE